MEPLAKGNPILPSNPVNLPPQIENEGAKNTLEIIIEQASFKKPFNYFIVIQLDGNDEKVKQLIITFI